MVEAYAIRRCAVPLYCVGHLSDVAKQTDRGVVLAEALVEMLRQQHIILSSIDVIERICSEALLRGTRMVYDALIAPLIDSQRRELDCLLSVREGTKSSALVWLRQPPGPPKPKHILTHLERLKMIHELRLPDDLERVIHQNRLENLARFEPAFRKN